MNESKGLASLMNLLKTYEDGPCAANPTVLDGISSLNNVDPSPNQPRNGTKKRYIWDELDANVDGILASTDQRASRNNPLHVPSESSTSIQPIKIKMKEMQKEYEKKSNHVDELKATLARKKLGQERNVFKLRAEWGEKMDTLAREFDKVSGAYEIIE